MPVLTVVAVPNGSGNSTFVQAMRFRSIDPDRLTAGYGEGFTPEANLRASRETLRLMQEHLEGQHNFVVETTLAGRQPLRLSSSSTRYHAPMTHHRLIPREGSTWKG
ncbi:hypothetical protein DAETH_07870 [Deinococcus aetherius]|uniref:Uncharacterized protein n=1 Tax=Deinococcus aetherius TaxID=200252 RepID=A0ABM8AAV7_9DEIO|nr:hypothetical protein [Deinococcus aetherius]BDP40818.1 hypothetical protein DAETH_07870 [Deinococcus aetherius]